MPFYRPKSSISEDPEEVHASMSLQHYQMSVCAMLGLSLTWLGRKVDFFGAESTIMGFRGVYIKAIQPLCASEKPC